MAYSVYTLIGFEWDACKATANLAKHGVSFEEAATVFGDAAGLDAPDASHSAAEPRRLRLGCSAAGRIVMVAYTARRRGDEEATRIISARAASRRERARYAQTGH
jgi:uncharacterized DUF497 family protein